MTEQRGPLRPIFWSALLCAALAACGGGGGGDQAATGTGNGTASGTASPPAPVDAPTTAAAPGGPGLRVASGVTPACTGCAAIDASTYAGSGVAVWDKANTTGAALDVPVSISGLRGQDVALVFTNETVNDVALAPINASAPAAQSILKDRIEAVVDDPHAGIREFNRRGWSDRIAAAQPAAARMSVQSSGAPNAATYAVGSTRRFYHEDGTTRTASLQRQLKAGDGVAVNVWVETTEVGAGKVSAALSDQLAGVFARQGGIYDMLKAAGGPLWGPHGYAELIAGAGQAIDIVVLNFDRNQQPYGMVGYFWSLHSLTKAADSRSNESVSMYLDAETLYLGGERGAKMAQMTLAHEGMHMSNFYRRGVAMGPLFQYDTWLEEMTAMMMEDAAASRIDPSYNPTRDVRLQDYLEFGSYNCALRNWTPFAGTCESYAVSGSFGGFLLRQLGVGFYQKLLAQRATSSEAGLDATIKAVAPTSGIGHQLRRFAASAVGTFPAAASPAGFGFPARGEGGFDIPAIDASAFAGARALPATPPASLLAYGNFPAVRRSVSGTFTEVVRVPAGATLSVVVR